MLKNKEKTPKKNAMIRKIGEELEICNQKLFFLNGAAGFVDVPSVHFRAQGMFPGDESGKIEGYPGTQGIIERGTVTEKSSYWPVYFCDPTVQAAPVWADAEDTALIQFHNPNDNGVNRSSHHGKYALQPYVFKDGNFELGKFPINPVGKTGISGRGRLGKWGPNHAADPIVTTVKDGNIYFVAIQRTDTGEWALPGGMVELGDNVSITVRKEFGEEAFQSLELTEIEKANLDAHLKVLFSNAVEVYRGYVDDPRNTDNAWMETVAMHVHIDEETANNFSLKAGDDAKKVEWKQYATDLNLYASHSHFITAAVRRLVQLFTEDEFSNIKLPAWVVKQFPVPYTYRQLSYARILANALLGLERGDPSFSALSNTHSNLLKHTQFVDLLRSGKGVPGLSESELRVLRKWALELK